MEDTISLETPLPDNDEETGIFAVFDGHGGKWPFAFMLASLLLGYWLSFVPKDSNNTTMPCRYNRGGNG